MDQKNSTRKFDKEKFNNIKLLIEKIKENDPFLYYLDLGEFEEIDETQKEELLKALSENKFAGNVRWNSELKDSEFKEMVEKKLSNNNFNYRQFPSDLIHGLLSSHVYKTEFHKDSHKIK